MTIKIYPNAMDGEPLETHTLPRPVLFAEWLKSKAPGFSLERDHPIGVCLNGAFLDSSEWGVTTITPACDVEIRVEPKAAALVIAAAVVVSAVVAYVVARGAKAPKARTTGKALGDAEVSANVVKFGDPIPEIAGSPLSYPSFLLPPASRYSGLRTQWASVFLCIGKGHYDVGLSDVFIGDTPAARLGDNVEVEFFGPGQSVSGNPAAEWWHTPEEVGFTTFGGSGMTLGRVSNVTPQWGANGFTVSGKTITGSTPPPTWPAGLLLRIPIENQVTFGADWVSSELLDSLGVTIGHNVTIELDGEDSETYQVIDISEPDPEEQIKYTLADAAFAIGTFRAAVDCAERPYKVVSRSGNSLTVDAQDVTAWAGFPAGSSIDAGVFVSPDDLSVGWTGPFRATPGNEVADAFEVDIFFPEGLIRYKKKNGHSRSRSAGGAIQWRYVGGEWNNYNFSTTQQTADQIGFTYRITLPEPGQIEVRVRSDRTASTSNLESDKQQWTGLRARISGAPAKYEGMTTMAVRMRTGDNISGGVENKVSIRARRKLPSLSNPNVLATTSDIAPFFLYMLESVGYGRDLVDMERLMALHEIWKLRADRFDLVIDSETTLKTVANYCLGAGFAEMTLRGGLITPVRDAMRYGPPSRIFSMQEYTSQLEEVTETIKLDEVDGVDVEYVDYRTGKTMTESFRLPGDEGRRVETIKAPGVTGRTLAWRQAARRRRVLAYRRTQYQGSTELQAMNAFYMDYVGLQDGIPEYGQSAFVTSVSEDGKTVTLSEEIIQPDGFLVAAVRKPDGTATLPAIVILGMDNKTLTFPEYPAGAVINAGAGAKDATVIYLGARQTLMHNALMQEVRPSADGRVTFVAIGDDERVYYDDDSGPDRSIITSQIYPMEAIEALAGGLAVTGVRKRTLNVYYDEQEKITSNFAITGIERRNAYRNYDAGALKVAMSMAITGIIKETIRKEVNERYLLQNSFAITQIIKETIAKYDEINDKTAKMQGAIRITGASKRKILIKETQTPKEINNSFVITQIKKVKK